MYDDELALANELADRAAEIALGYFGGEFEIKRKPDRTPVTEADLAIEAMMREVLAERFPGDAILGEEQGLTGDAERVWVLDPIDGTKNFADGVPIWGTLIALQVDAVPVLGLASAPTIGERYAAVRGQGATMNGRPIHVRHTTTELSEALVAFGGLEVWLSEEYRERFSSLVLTVRRARGLGDFWGHALVARGAADVMLEPRLRTWDFAGLSVIVEEAGGTISQLDGSALADHGSVISSNGVLHDEVLRRLTGEAGT
ncbi:MAG: inositol monophosphatase family protein [Actinomycetota bacterium]